MFPFLVIFCLHIDVLTFVPFIYNKTRLVTRCKIVVPPSSKFRMKRAEKELKNYIFSTNVMS